MNEIVSEHVSASLAAIQGFPVVSCGMDIVHIPTFRDRMVPAVLERTLTDYELREFPRLESKAGLFAAKEAFMKAVHRKIDWHEVWVERKLNGQPVLHSLCMPDGCIALVTISHDGDYAAAVVLIGRKPE